MSEVDEQIARARATMARISEEYRRPVTEKLGTVYRAHGKRLKRKAVGVGTRFAIICAVNAIILIAAAVAGMVVPLGLFGGLVALFLTGNSLSYTAVIGFVALIGISGVRSPKTAQNASASRRSPSGVDVPGAFK